MATVQAPAKLAVFDVDGTIIRGQSGALFIRYLAERGCVPRLLLLRVAVWGFFYKYGAPLDYRKMANRILAAVADQSTVSLESHLDNFMNERLVSLLRPSALAAIADHRDRGDIVILASGSISPIISRLAAHLGIEKWVATSIAPSLDDHVAHHDVGPILVGPSKLDVLVRYLDEQFQAWQMVAAYSDHETDLALLDAAAAPFAVSPTKGLRRIARERGWPVKEWD